MINQFKKNMQIYTWWEITIFIIGSISFLTILLMFFLPLGSGPSMLTTTSVVPAVTSPSFVPTLSDSLTLPIEQGNPIEILNNGDAFMASLLADIDNAHSSINIMTYIWNKGVMSDKIFEHLDAKLKEGISIRIMLDAYGATGAIKRQEFKTFEDLGGKVKVFHSFTIAPWNIAHNQKRNHRRAIVIDGKIGYTGGMAISDTWLGNARNSNEWRDMMFRVTGPMARDVQGAFAELWASNTGELLTGESFYPQITSEKVNTITYIPLVSTPSADSLVMQKFILLSILGAHQKIYISTPYFLPDPSLSDALIAKAKEGVDVRILVPNGFNDSQSVRHASQYLYENLLENGVKIYEYQPTFIHIKSMVIDGEWSIIGSANMDNRSRKLNEENIFGISDKDFGSSVENVFLSNLKDSKEINLSDWKKRGLWQRIREVFARKLVQQY
jgi:cardiolipin synthase